MKVQVTYTEVQYYKTTRIVDMTVKEYNECVKNGRVSFDLETELCSECDEEKWFETAHFNTEIDKVKDINK